MRFVIFLFLNTPLSQKYSLLHWYCYTARQYTKCTQKNLSFAFKCAQKTQPPVVVEGGSLLNNANAVHLTEYVCLYIPRGKMSFFQFDNSFPQNTILPTTRLYEDALSIAIVDSTKIRGLFCRIIYSSFYHKLYYSSIKLTISPL